jgi:hypothetical protein
LQSEWQNFQILEGSHKCGRVDHHPVLKQAEADLDRVEEIKKTCPHKFVEMNPGGYRVYNHKKPQLRLNLDQVWLQQNKKKNKTKQTKKKKQIK